MLQKIMESIDPLIPYTVLQIVKWILAVVDLVLYATTGYSLLRGSQAEVKQAKRENLTAQVVKIYGRATPCALIPADLSCYLYTHEKYVDSSYILNNPKVILFAITDTEAFFSVADADLYDTANFPFAFLGQLLGATKLVIVSHATLNKMGEEVGDPKVPVTLLHMTARCGSTLLAQALNVVPGTRVLSEPWCFNWLNYYYRKGHLFRWEHDELLKNGMRLLCKMEPGTKIDRIAFKTSNYIPAQVEALHEMFPKFNLIYNTRNVMPSLKSFVKVIEKNLTHTMAAYTGHAWDWVRGSELFPLDDPKYEKMLAKYQTYFQYISYEESFTTFLIIGQYLSYMKAKDRYRGVILFEEIEDDPKEAFRKLLKFSDIPESYLEETLKVTGRDSQNGILAPRGYSKELLTQENLDKAERLFKEFQVPLSLKMTLSEYKKALGMNE